MAMQPHSSFDALSRVIEQLDSACRTVRNVEAVAGGAEGEALRAAVEVSTPLRESTMSDASSGFDASSAALDGDGVQVCLRDPTLSESAIRDSLAGNSEHDVSIRPTDVRLDGGVLLTLEVVLRPLSGGKATAVSDGEATAVSDGDSGSVTDEAANAGPKDPDETAASEADASDRDRPTDLESGGATDTSDGDETATEPVETRTERDADDALGSALAAVRDESVPPYEDTPYLQRLYEACDTFAEMRERIEMDVSAETVRRYMIEAGVHSPTSYATGDAEQSAGGDGQAPPTTDSDRPTAAGSDSRTRKHALPDEQLLADGIGLPEGLSLGDVADAVVDSRTVYEVQRELGIDQQRTRRLLRQLNVLDLVLRRVSDEPDRRVSYDTVTARIRQCTPDDARE